MHLPWTQKAVLMRVTCLIVLCGVCAEITTGLHTNDLKAWQAFYDSTNGDNWFCCQQQSSSVRTNPCDCSDMIVCTNATSTGNVTFVEKILLANCGLTGTLPTEIADFVALSVLHISNNQISGTIPQQLPTTLSSILFANNRIFGVLPQLQNLTRLTVFDGSSNQLTGEIPALPPTTQFFITSQNFLSGSLPSLNKTLDLVAFDAAENLLAGTLPSLRALTNLKVLSLFKNSFHGTIPPLSPCLGGAHSQPPTECAQNDPSRMLLLHENYLSCDLPHLHPARAPPATLVSVGNGFSNIPQTWTAAEKNAPGNRMTDISNPLLMVVLFCGGIFALSMLILVLWIARSLSANGNNRTIACLMDAVFPPTVSVRAEDASVALLVLCSRTSLLLSCFGVAVFLPIYLGGDGMFDCTDAMIRCSISNVDLRAHKQPVQILLVLCCIFVVCCALYVFRSGQFVFWSRGIELAQTLTVDENVHPQPSDNYHHHHHNHNHSHSSLGEPRGHRKWVGLVVLSVIAAFGVSMIGLLPVYLQMRPHDNYNSAWWYLAPSVWFVCNVIVLPMLCAALVLIVTPTEPFRVSPTKRVEFVRQSLVLLMRIVLVICPLLPTIFLDNDCMQLWKNQWEPCTNKNSTFDLVLPTADKDIFLSLNHTHTICSTDPSQIDSIQCLRRVAEVWNQVILVGLCATAFLSPVFVLVRAVRTHARYSTNLASVTTDAMSWLCISLMFCGISPLIVVASTVALGARLLVVRLILFAADLGLLPPPLRSNAFPPLRGIFLAPALCVAITFWALVSVDPSSTLGVLMLILLALLCIVLVLLLSVCKLLQFCARGTEPRPVSLTKEHLSMHLLLNQDATPQNDRVSDAITPAFA